MKMSSRKAKSCAKFLWDPDDGTILGRSCKSWCSISVCYLVLYGCLTGFFASLLTIFLTTLDVKYPKLQDGANMIKMNPGLGYRPMVNYAMSLIHFEASKLSTYVEYLDNIKLFLKQYDAEYQHDKNNINRFKDCVGQDLRANPSKDEVCIYDANATFSTEQVGTGGGTVACGEHNDYGFLDGNPCILLKINRVYNWKPELYAPADKNNDLYKAILEEAEILGFSPDNTHIGVTCQGKTKADEQNIRAPAYSHNGFNQAFFPYMNQKGYKSPLVVVQFQGIPRGVVVHIWCRLWAKNIDNKDKNKLEGSVMFELLVE